MAASPTSTHLYSAPFGLANVDTARRSQIDPTEECHSQIGKADDEGQFDKVAACQHSPNLTERSITIRSNPLALHALNRLINEPHYYDELTTLTLQGPRFCPRDTHPSSLDSIPTALRTRSMLLELTLNLIPISPEQITLLAQAIRTHCSLQKICFSSNNLENLGLHRTFQALKGHPSLSSVAITNNCEEMCEDETAETMAGALTSIPNLSFLDLHGNNITEKGALIIAENFEHRPDVQLILSGRLVLLPAVKNAMLEALHHNYAMTRFGLPESDGDADFQGIFSRNIIVQEHRASTLFSMLYKQWMINV